MFRRAIPTAVCALAVAAFAACGSGSSGAPPPSAVFVAARAAAAKVTIAGFAYLPKKLSVKAGTTVTWTNDDNVIHTVTAENKSFTSPYLKTNKTWSHLFGAPGQYAYFCKIHRFMHGTVVVTP